MPYITKERRSALWSESTVDYDNNMKTAGELNFMLTELILIYQKHKGLSYQTINDIVGALEGCKSEYYRRVAIPYEKKKIKDNGDVYL